MDPPPHSVERRVQPRFKAPICRYCDSPDTVVLTARVADVLYIRCQRCAEMWGVVRPHTAARWRA